MAKVCQRIKSQKLQELEAIKKQAAQIKAKVSSEMNEEEEVYKLIKMVENYKQKLFRTATLKEEEEREDTVSLSDSSFISDMWMHHIPWLSHADFNQQQYN